MTSSYRLHGLRNEFIVNAALSSEANLTSEKKKKKIKDDFLPALKYSFA